MKKKLVVDILMFILMILEFSRMHMSTIIHEIIGILLLILVILHLVLNKNYIKNINNGKYNLKRTIMLIINILFMISFILCMLFGILSSQDLFKFLNVDNISIIKFHKILSYVSLLLMGFHLGINFDMIFGKIRNKIIIYILKIIVICFGIYSWIKLDFWNHLIGKYMFSTVNGNLITNILEYFSVVMMISVLVDFIYKKGNRNER